MEPKYREQFTVRSTECDTCNRIKPAALMSMLQEAAGAHCHGTDFDWYSLAARGMFFAISRQYVRINRLPVHRETVTVETWPGLTTRVAFPRHTVVYDQEGNELVRAVSVWVLVDLKTRAMILPGKGNVGLLGFEHGGELPIPGAIPARAYGNQAQRRVVYTELDVNSHMNNTRYLDWVMDLLPAQFHREHALREFTISFINEARLDEQVDLSYQLDPDGTLHVEGTRAEPDERGKHSRVFAVKAAFGG